MNSNFRCFVAILLVLRLFGGCPAIAAQAEGPTSQKHERYDGKTLFRGFFFGAGPVGKVFPELFKNVKETPESAKKEEAWMEKINKSDPAFFQRFGEMMYSGKRIAVERALEEGSDKIADVIGAELGVSGAELRSGKFGRGGDQSSALGLAIFAAVFWVAAVVATVAAENTAAIHYTVAITSHVTFWNKLSKEQQLYPGYDRESRLARERFINVVVTRLGLESH